MIKNNKEITVKHEEKGTNELDKFFIIKSSLKMFLNKKFKKLYI